MCQWTLPPFPTLKGPQTERHLVTPQYGLNDPPLEKKINWNDAEPVKGKLTVLTQHLNLHDFENPNLASSFERLKIFPRNTKRDLEEN